ncbi:hypothetical protein CC117_22410 [Parafrankia colletiae]|uniref:MFS transporter n=2 Tax=Parafrankia colletiae TaxID=573497 RepID=A0A1S1QLC4_9ACTN|nr:hypothetical protein CC117_22410 [Parafrankia colletiae]
MGSADSADAAAPAGGTPEHRLPALPALLALPATPALPAAAARQGSGALATDGPLPGVGGQRLGLRAAVGTGGVGLVGVLGALNLLDNAERAVLIVLGPDIQRSLGFSDAALGGLVGLSAVILTAGAIPIGLLADRRRRTAIAAVAAALAGVFALLTSVVANTFQLVLARIGAGFGQAAVLPVHNSLLADGYPLHARTAVLTLHNLAGPVGLVIAPVTAGGVAALAGGSAGWRWAFVLFAGVLLLFAAIAAMLREPPRGRGERMEVLGAHGDPAGVTDPSVDAPSSIPLEIGAARLLKIQTLRYLFAAIGALGFALVGVPTFFNSLLEERYHLDALDRGLVGSVTQVGVMIGVVAGARLGDARFRRDPPSVLLFMAVAFAAHGVLLTVALTMGPLPALVGCVTVAEIPLGMVLVPLYSVISIIVPYRLRALGFAAVGVCVTLFGGFLGGVLLGDVSDQHGPRVALLALAGPASLAAAALTAYAARFVRADLAAVVEEIAEERAETLRVATGGAQPILQVRNLDVSYGPMQVLFGVDLDVERGEVLALLGTNGAGKSTLLRTVAGLEVPHRGVVRHAGRTITLDPPERRVRDGIVLVQGGAGVFGTLTVAENLLVGAHVLGRDGALVARRAEEVLDLFPKLRDLLDAPASTLSGGEQQMLALAKALLTRPEVLCVDELSLGLAPTVVAELIEVVAGLRRDGVTVVLVEQSVNVAAAVADRAVFLEKGRIRFSGRPADLLERGDLVRAVFLGTVGGPHAAATADGGPR